MNIRERFESNYVPEPNSGCWLWLGHPVAEGYGSIYLDGKERRAHRVAMMLYRGFDLDSPLLVIHSCDVPACVNPDHLRTGTNADNTRDAIERGRLSSRHGRPTKTHCIRGHERIPENLYVYGTSRKCKICRHERYRNR